MEEQESNIYGDGNVPSANVVGNVGVHVCSKAKAMKYSICYELQSQNHIKRAKVNTNSLVSQASTTTIRQINQIGYVK